MGLLVHDFAGHPFAIALARELAAGGEEVTYAYNARLETPRGGVEPRPGDPDRLRIVPIDIGEDLAKHRYVRRLQQERRYGRAAARLVRDLAPTHVLAANTPLDVLVRMQAAARRTGAQVTTWLQDVQSEAVAQLVGDRLPLVGPVAVRRYARLEARLLRASDRVVVICPEFARLAMDAGVAVDRIEVVPNWAPIEELPTRPRDNALRRSVVGTTDALLFVYAGTIGRKHSGESLLRLARSLRAFGATLLVVSEGEGADAIARAAHDEHLTNLRVLPFQPYDDLPDLLGAADVLVAILDEGAARFSVPSKVLSYLCAGRPIVAAIAADNLAARTITGAGAGLVVPPGDDTALVDAASRLAAEPGLRQQMGAAGRAYAEASFPIPRIAAEFRSLLGITTRTPVPR